jgi:hypothetical protein
MFSVSVVVIVVFSFSFFSFFSSSLEHVIDCGGGEDEGEDEKDEVLASTIVFFFPLLFC